MTTKQGLRCGVAIILFIKIYFLICISIVFWLLFCVRASYIASGWIRSLVTYLNISRPSKNIKFKCIQTNIRIILPRPTMLFQTFKIY